jgi:hypothetical protein
VHRQHRLVLVDRHLAIILQRSVGASARCRTAKLEEVFLLQWERRVSDYLEQGKKERRRTLMSLLRTFSTSCVSASSCSIVPSSFSMLSRYC